MANTLKKLGIEGNGINLVNAIYKKLQLTQYLMIQDGKLSPKDIGKAR